MYFLIKILLSFSFFIYTASGYANTKNFKCWIADQSVSSTNRNVEMPMNSRKTITLDNGLHDLQLNNYEGALLLSLRDLAAREDVLNSTFDGRSLSFRIKNPLVYVECRLQASA